MSTDPIVIASAARTPMGAFMGDLKSLAAPELGAVAIRVDVHVDAAADGGVLDRVRQQVAKDLLQALPIAHHADRP